MLVLLLLLDNAGFSEPVNGSSPLSPLLGNEKPEEANMVYISDPRDRYKSAVIS